jgi:sn-glycerol 3-phosphate transport system permease protein
VKRFSIARHINGWLFLMPAVCFLTLFTYWPAAKTLVESFYSTARPRRPAHFIGIDQYRQLIEDPVFWQALTNNAWSTIASPAARWRAWLTSRRPCCR